MAKPTGRSRLVSALAFVLASLALLVGCSSLPRSGEVHVSQAQPSPRDDVGVFARGPRAEDTPEQIVEGFLTAVVAGFPDDFAVAREFLSPEAAAAWDPLAQFQVYGDNYTPEISVDDADVVTLSVPAYASVDSRGIYTPAAEGSTLQRSFAIARNSHGEWRISELEDGMILQQANFDKVFTDASLYFLSPTRNTLVPELRWYPRQALATSLLLGLLGGPSPWLAPGVTTAFSSGADLTLATVVVEEGVAQVRLSPETLPALNPDRGRALAQLEKTLSAIPEVQSLEVLAGSTPITPGVSIPDLPSYPLPTIALRVAFADGIGKVESEGIIPISARPGPDDPALSHPAVSYDASRPRTVAIAEGAGIAEVPTLGPSPNLVWANPDPIAPAFDAEGWIWSGERTNAGALTTISPSEEIEHVSARWLEGSSVHLIAPSREGSRILVIRKVGQEDRAASAVIVRRGNGVPLALGDPVEIGVKAKEILDGTWIDENTVALLIRPPNKAKPVIALVSLGGPMRFISAPDDAVSITGALGERSLVVGSGDGTLYQRNGASWRTILADNTQAKDPAYPG